MMSTLGQMHSECLSAREEEEEEEEEEAEEEEDEDVRTPFNRTQPFSQRQMCPQPIFTCPPALGGVDSAGLLSLQGTARSEHIKISPVHVMEAPAAVGVKTRRLFQLTLPPITSVILRGIYMPDDLAPP
ncbi:hypothetical protein AK812_SmicGene19092 [Symbiodinium microadriaticum]|uniref:Uncharacterized protein n=1 Tax=Symbiodinium microadriaticum TaxID=2951 RepID=A0A1Q9DTK7_SYMMI|nr:hypothetical protein AK812_SmicGene19092 [Symbiodinium microadriaticum]